MGLVRSLRNFSFYLQAPFDNGLTEHELDRMIGYYNEDPVINPEEVEVEMDVDQVKQRYDCFSDQYTVWFKIIFDEFYHYLEDHKI
jgi:isopentenyl-diphosphate delta-isomerase